MPDHLSRSGERPPTFEFGEGGIHNIGDKECPECWIGYPKSCEQEGCGGLLHAHFGDENYDGEYWLFKQCDTCGGSE